jgi:hypothetical protein
MKKTVVSILLALFILSSFSVFAYADEGESTYRDDSLQISFTIPDGWTRYSDVEGGQIKYAFYKDSSEEGTFFVYSVVDLYTTLSAEDRDKHDRSDINNSSITIEQFRQLMQDNLTEEQGITNISMDPATVNGKSYFKMNFNQKYENVDDLETVVVYAHIYNGYATYYRYETFEDTLDEAEAEAIVSTVVFENEKGSNKTQTTFEKTTKEIGKSVGMSALKRGLLFAGGAAILAAFGGIGAKSKKKKKGQQINANVDFSGQNIVPQGVPVQNAPQSINPQGVPVQDIPQGVENTNPVPANTEQPVIQQTDNYPNDINQQ